MRRSLLMIVLAIQLFPAAIAETTLEIYQPKHRAPQALIRTLAPLYPDATFSSDERQLFIKAPALSVNEMRELLVILDKPLPQYLVTFSNQQHPQKNKIYSTANTKQQSFTINNGQTLLLARQQYRQQPKGSLGPWIWLQIENAPEQQEYLQLEVEGAGETFTVSYTLHYENSGQFSQLSHSLSGHYDKWFPLLHKKAQATTTDNYSTASRSPFKQFIKIELLR